MSLELQGSVIGYLIEILTEDPRVLLSPFTAMQGQSLKTVAPSNNLTACSQQFPFKLCSFR
jgi:hypothetical protein